MFKKSFLLSLVALLLTSALINPPVFADHGEFKPFNLKDYQLPNNLTKGQAIRQIIEFSSKIQYDIDNCNGPDENKHKMYCTNIHEADRLRLAYLLNLNSEIPQEKINEKTLKRVAIKSVSFSIPNGYAPAIIFKGDVNSIINSDSRIDMDNIITPFTEGIDTLPEYKFSRAVEYGLKTIALPDLKDRKISDARLKVANMSPEDLKNVTNEDILGISPINHSVLSLVLEMFQKKSNLDFFDEDKFKNWIAFNEKEAHYFALNDAEYDKIQNNKIDFEKYTRVESGCVFRGFSALLLCAPTRFMAGTTQGAVDLINKKNFFHLNVDMLNRSTNGKKDGHIKIAWMQFRDLANISLIVVFILLSLAKITNYNRSEYNIKKIVPKLAMIAIILNSSFFLIQLSAEFSNVIGNGIEFLLNSLSGDSVDLIKLTKTILAGSLGAGAIAVFAPYVFIPLLIGALVAVFTVIIALAIRDAIFVILIILSPIAVISLILPNTSNLYRIWLKMFSGILLLFPTIALLLGSGSYIGHLMNKSDVVLLEMVSFVPIYLPFLFIPKIVFGLVGRMPIFGNKISSMLSGASSNLTSKYKNSEDYKDRVSDFKRQRQQKERQATGLDFKKDFGSIKSWRPFGKNRPSFLSINNWVKYAKGLPGVVDKGFADLVAKPETDPELFKQLTDEALDFTKVDPIAAEHFIKSLDPSHSVSTAGLSPQQLTQFNLLNSSYAKDPNKILIAMMAMSNLGKGNFDDIVNSTNQFLKLGGDESLLDSTMFTMMKNYKKESEFETSALLLETLKKAKSDYKTNFNISTSPLDFVNKTSLNHKTSRDNIVFKSYAKTTDWKKFTGYTSNKAADAIFSRYITGLSPDLKRKVLSDIRSQTSSQDALDYIDKFD